MSDSGDQAHGFDFDSGRLCLDFINTVGWHASDEPVEHLFRYADLVAWAQAAELLTPHEAQSLTAKARNAPAESAAVLERAHALREALFRIFTSLAQGVKPAAADFGQLNAVLSVALAHRRMTCYQNVCRWVWTDTEDAADWMLWPVALDASELLTSEALDRVKMCEDDRGCGYLFVDMSRNRSRRWCSMESCGNRAKVQRYRKREHAES